MSEPARDERVLAGPVLHTFFYFAVPSLVGLVAISTANVVDGMFVGHFVGADALAAVTFMIPYFALLFGCCLMLAVGGTVRAGKYLGEGNADAASSVFSMSVIGAACLSVGAGVLSSAFDEVLFGWLGAPAGLFPLMRSYFRVISPVLVVQLVTMVIYYFVRVGGRPMLATGALVLGASTNIAGDALLVGHFGFGLPGAAGSTGVAQLLALGLLLTHFRGPQPLRFRPALRDLGQIARSAFSGASELINEVSVGVFMLITNWLMITRVGVDGVAAFAVVNYAVFISLMLFYGISDALHLLVSQNLGARNHERIRAFSLTAACVVALISGTFSLTLLLWGEHWLGFFLAEPSKQALERAQGFLGLIWPVFLVNGFNVLMTVYLTALHRPMSAGALALSRSLLMPIGFMLAFAFWAPEWPFLLALPVAEWATFGVGVWLVSRARPGAFANAPYPGQSTEPVAP